ncbi:MAG: response regulator transcription factor [Chloroflexi bacterium]|nr:response regulator transcription factor [Chloroflexota bacterium]
MRILVVEDEEDLANAIAKGLRKHGYAVDTALEGEAGWEAAAINDYDLLILDLNLPGLDGLEICRRLRHTRTGLLILMLTARIHPSQRIEGLDLGADDYLIKPFHWGELMARVRALLRRKTQEPRLLLRCGDLTLDLAAQIAVLGNRQLQLTGKEFSILEYLMRHQGKVIGQQELLDHIWDNSANAFTNAVRVHINSLRRKLQEDAKSPRYIETVIGRGYRMQPDAIASAES